MKTITTDDVCKAIELAWRLARKSDPETDRYHSDWQRCASQLDGMWLLVNFSAAYTQELLDDIGLLRNIAAARWLGLKWEKQ